MGRNSELTSRRTFFYNSIENITKVLGYSDSIGLDMQIFVDNSVHGLRKKISEGWIGWEKRRKTCWYSRGHGEPSFFPPAPLFRHKDYFLWLPKFPSVFPRFGSDLR